MLSSGALFILLLTGLSGMASSDEPLLFELRDRYRDAQIWPQSGECADDCIAAALSIFKYGRWRVHDWDCMRDYEAAGVSKPELCTEHLNWKLGGVFHPRDIFEWLDDDLKPSGETDPLVFAGDVTFLLRRKSPSRLFLIQTGIFRPLYRLVEAEGDKEIITKLTEYSLNCEGAGAPHWDRLGYRQHAGRHDIFKYDYCEIRDLEAFRNLARKA